MRLNYLKKSILKMLKNPLTNLNPLGHFVVQVRFRVQGPGSRVQGPGSRVQGPGSRVQEAAGRVLSRLAWSY